MNKLLHLFVAVLALSFVIYSYPATAEIKEYNIVIKNHKFIPDNLTVPANTRFKIIVDNQDESAEEFESNDFHREKIIPAKSKATIFVSPLEAGEYKFFGEFNPDTAQGILHVVDK